MNAVVRGINGPSIEAEFPSGYPVSGDATAEVASYRDDMPVGTLWERVAESEATK